MVGLVTRGLDMKSGEVKLFEGIRNFSSVAILVGIILSLVFSQVLGESSMQWQVVIAIAALAIGIPHGALDHLVTLPKSRPLVMAGFIAVYVLIAIVAVIATLEEVKSCMPGRSPFCFRELEPIGSVRGGV